MPDIYGTIESLAHNFQVSQFSRTNAPAILEELAIIG